MDGRSEALMLMACLVACGDASPQHTQDLGADLRTDVGQRDAGTCAALESAGTWSANIAPVKAPPTETSGKNFSEAIVVDPFDAATVWWGSGLAGIFKSTDCGTTWVHINTGRNGDLIDQSGAGSMALDPIHRGVMYTTAFEGANGLWKSINGGVDWDQLFPPESELAKVVDRTLVNSVAMDAADPNHLVVSMHAKCNGNYGAVCEAESLDAGEHWTITTVPVMDGNGLAQDYVAGAGAFILNSSTWLFGSYANGLLLTTDHGKSWVDVTPAGATGATAGKTLVLPFMPNAVDKKYYLPSMQGVLQGSLDGKTWTLLPDSGGRTVGLVMGGGNFYSSDQWSNGYHVASQSDATHWDTLAPPPTLPDGLGAPYLAFDQAHHILYSSNFAGGLYRLVTK